MFKNVLEQFTQDQLTINTCTTTSFTQNFHIKKYTNDEYDDICLYFHRLYNAATIVNIDIRIDLKHVSEYLNLRLQQIAERNKYEKYDVTTTTQIDKAILKTNVIKSLRVFKSESYDRLSFFISIYILHILFEMYTESDIKILIASHFFNCIKLLGTNLHTHLEERLYKNICSNVKTILETFSYYKPTEKLSEKYLPEFQNV